MNYSLNTIRDFAMLLAVVTVWFEAALVRLLVAPEAARAVWPPQHVHNA
jgi:hypothetical protein